MDMSKAARALGRAGGLKGGKVTGPSKRRGDAEHYRRLRAMRRPPQVYEAGGGGGGYSVREGLRDWIVDTWSILSGTRTGERWLVPYSTRLPRSMRLDAPANYTGTLNAEIIVEERTRGRCLRRGHVVR